MNRSDKTDRLCENYTARELLWLLNVEQFDAVYNEAASLMEWNSNAED